MPAPVRNVVPNTPDSASSLLRHARVKESISALIALLALLSPSLAAVPRQGARQDFLQLAVVSDPALRSVADLWAAELAKDTSVGILRTGVADGLVDTALGYASQLDDSHQVDGVVIISKEVGVAGNIFSIRLVAPRTGVILWHGLMDPVERPTQKDVVAPVARFLSQVRMLYPKLKVAASEAVRLHIAPFSSNIDGSSVQHEEFSINMRQHLIHRLAQEPEVFVLERTALNLLQDEFVQAEEQRAPFWTASYILEGVVHWVATEPDQVSVELRISPPETEGIAVGLRRVQVFGNINKVNELSEEIVAQVLTVLKKTGTPVSWDPIEEGKQLAERALSLSYSDRSRAAAYAAAESAWALGYHGSEAVELRVRKLLNALHPEFERYMLSPGTAYHAGPVLPFLGSYPLEMLREEMKAHPEEHVRQVNHLTEALRLLNTFYPPARRSVPPPSRLEGLVVEAILLSSGMLQIVHEVADGGSYPDGVAVLRRETRQLAAALMHPENVLDANEIVVYQLAAYFAPYWHDTPTSTIDFYRNLLLKPPDGMRFRTRADAYRARAMVHQLVGHRRGSQPRLVAWGGAVSAEDRAQWSELVETLCRSNDPGDRLLALYFKRPLATDAAALRQLQDLAAAALDDLSGTLLKGGPEGTAYLHLFLETVQGEAANRYQDLYLQLAMAAGQEQSRSVRSFTRDEVLRAITPYLQPLQGERAVQLHAALNHLDSKAARALKEKVFRVQPTSTQRASPPVLKPSFIWRGRMDGGALPDHSMIQPSSITWHGGRLWFLEGKYIIGLDPVSLAVKKVPLPESAYPPHVYQTMFPSRPHLAVSDDYFVLSFVPHGREERWIDRHDRRQKERKRVARLSATLGRPVLLNHKLYYHTLGEHEGIVCVNLDTETIEEVRLPDDLKSKRKGNFRPRSILGIYGSPSGELLVQGIPYAFAQDPDAGTWRRVSVKEWADHRSPFHVLDPAGDRRDPHDQWPDPVFWQSHPRIEYLGRGRLLFRSGEGGSEDAVELSLPKREGRKWERSMTIRNVSETEWRRRRLEFLQAVTNGPEYTVSFSPTTKTQVERVGVVTPHGIALFGSDLFFYRYEDIVRFGELEHRGEALGAAPASATTWPAESGEDALLFSGTGLYAGHGKDIYRCAPASRNVQNLTRHFGRAWNPKWSPDGRRIAFLADWHGNADVFVMNADGTETRNLTSTWTREFEFDWAPGSDRIALCESSTEGRELVVYDLEGNKTYATRGLAGIRSVLSTGIDWSPDGERLAFIALGPKKTGLDGKLRSMRDVYTLALPTRTLTRQTHDEAKEKTLAWSPDGSMLAYAVEPGNVYLRDLSTGETTTVADWRLAEVEASGKRGFLPDSFNLAWSPDARRLAFGLERDGQDGLFLAETRDPTRITHVPLQQAERVAWSTDGTTIYCQGMNAESHERIYAVPVGAGQAQECVPLILNQTHPNVYGVIWE